MSGFGADTLVPGQAGASDWAAGSLVLINLQGLPNDSGGMMSPTRNFGKLYGGGYQTRPVAAEEELASPLPLAYKREGGSVEQADSTAWMNDPYHPNWRSVSGHKAGGADVTKGAGKKIPNCELCGPPNKRGNAPIGKDGHPVELHHRNQNPKGPLDEMTRTDHRLGDNFKKNHSNTGQNASQIDRSAWRKEQKDYWKNEWDSGRFDGM